VELPDRISMKSLFEDSGLATVGSERAHPTRSATMKALSIRQPWAWLIVRPDLSGDERSEALRNRVLKSIENRSWPTRFRGRFYVHAAMGMTRTEYSQAQQRLLSPGGPQITLPSYENLPRGGIVGSATLVDCVEPADRNSWWHVDGQCGFQLSDVEPLAFRPCKGRLMFFDVPENPASPA